MIELQLERGGFMAEAETDAPDRYHLSKDLRAHWKYGFAIAFRRFNDDAAQPGTGFRAIGGNRLEQPYAKVLTGRDLVARRGDLNATHEK